MEKPENNTVLQIWKWAQTKLSVKAQERVLERLRVKNDFLHALRQEGIIMCRFRGNVSKAQEMAEAGELKVVNTKPLRNKGNFRKAFDENKLIEKLAERNEKELVEICDRPEAEVIKGFIPRPKNK